MHAGSIAITSASGEVHEIALHSSRLCIGSAPGNDIVLDGPEIGPQHATIVCDSSGRLILEIGAENLVGQGGMRLTFNLGQMTRQRDLAWIGEYVISYQPPRWNCRTQPIALADLAGDSPEPKAAPAARPSADDTMLLHTLLRQTLAWQPAGELAHEAATLAMPMMLLSAAAE
jgi:hypothetical protein